MASKVKAGDIIGREAPGLSHGGPSAWEDESFGVRFAFFAQTDAERPPDNPLPTTTLKLSAQLTLLDASVESAKNSRRLAVLGSQLMPILLTTEDRRLTRRGA